jgi:hypothetical protein
MIQPTVRVLCTAVPHLPLLFVWRDSGVTQRQGFELAVDVPAGGGAGQFRIPMNDCADMLLAGTYDFLSGLHQQTYIYRARGDKRLVYVAQGQNTWAGRVVATPEIGSAEDLAGKRFLVTSAVPCVFGNLEHCLTLAGVDLERVQFVEMARRGADHCRQAVEAVARGEAAATHVDVPFDKLAERYGLRSLPVPTVPVVHNLTLCGNREWIVQHEETTLAVLRSLIDAIHFFKTERSRVCEILERTLAPLIGIETPAEIEYLQEDWAGLLCARPYPHPLAVWNVYHLLAEHEPSMAFIGPFEVWDTSYLRTIDDSGYIDELYGGAARALSPPVTPSISWARARVVSRVGAAS